MELLKQMLREGGGPQLRIHEMLAPLERLFRPGFRTRALRIILVPLLLHRAGLFGLGNTRLVRGHLLERGIRAQLRIHQLPKFRERSLEHMQTLLHLRRQRLLQRHPRHLLHSSHIWLRE